jgi:soluble lytic murein transglycosylase
MKKVFFSLLIIAVLLGACNRYQSGSAPMPVEPEPSTTPEATPMPTLPPTATPLSTPAPTVSIAEGDQALFHGDWEAALQAYIIALETSGDDLERYCSALLGLGRSFHHLEQHAEALLHLGSLVELCPDSPAAAGAHITAAQAHTNLDQYQQAAESYAAYLEMRPGLIDSYIQERRGDVLVDAGDLLTAIDAYQAALAAPRQGDTLHIEIKIANVYVALGDHETALVAYEDIYERSTNDYTKAHLDYLIGQSYTALGQMDQAYAAYFDAVENYPLSYDSYQALILLVEAGQPVNEFDRGLVDYFAGQYNLAIAAFDRYIDSSTENVAAAYYYKGLAYRALGSPEIAIQTWDTLIEDYPEDERADDGWEAKAYTQWAYLDQYEDAVQTMLDFVSKNPSHSRAAEFLFHAARIAERDRDLSRAATLWLRIPDEYPSSDLIPEAIFLAGIARYRQGDYNKALGIFERYLGTSSDSGVRAQAHFWVGKSLQAMENLGAAESAWELAAATDPSGYYSERARDILLGREPFTPPIDYDLGFDPEAERAEADAWMRETFAIPPETDLSGPGPLLNDLRLTRGTELWNLAMYDQANLEFQALWQDIRSSPVDNYRLANYLVDLGAYYTAIFAAREVLNLNQMDDAATLNAPMYFNYLRFGSYFGDLIIPTANAYDFHPLFLFSLVRQESLFAGWVQSSAGASGLMQIIPSTGEYLAEQVGWPPDFTTEDLYRPVVSVTLGTDYLSNQRDYFDGDLYAALAAYNAGPGNAAIWKGLAEDDPDLFLEVIRFEETRRYIRGIYEIFAIYRRLYDRTP